MTYNQIKVIRGVLLWSPGTADIWGMKTGECQRAIKEKTGIKTKLGMIVIVPAGENLVKYASIISDERAAGRTGMGAATTLSAV